MSRLILQILLSLNKKNMKKFILLFIALVFAMSVNAQLNMKAQVFKDKFPRFYAPIRKGAVAKWKDDNSMIIYTINKECEALSTIMTKEPYKSYLNAKDDTTKQVFMVETCKKWTENGSTSWSMVKYQIDKQEKNSDY
jgi:hypothetical protein